MLAQGGWGVGVKEQPRKGMRIKR